jgi:CheY-like chemotaxis protein
MKTSDRKPIEILMIDDNPADVELVRETFQEKMSDSVLNVARDGGEALLYLRRAGRYRGAARPDLILLDLNMPGMNGFDVLHEIRRDNELCCIPVVILTSSTAQVDIDRGYQSKANAYLSKPAGLDQFSDLVRTLEAFWLEVARLPSRHCGNCSEV